jgi:hypothetical protein
LKNLKGRLSLSIEGNKFSVESEIIPQRCERLEDAGKEPREHFLVARDNVTSLPSFTAIER